MRQLTGFAMLFCVLLSVNLSANHVDEYIQNYKDIAQREMNRSGIPASIILAQGIAESAWGQGELAVSSNNHFGIKCKDYWQGPTYYIEDDDYVNGKLVKSCFRAYDDVETSYIDHTDFLVKSDRYKILFTYGTTDYKNWAKGLKKCGYATDPQYAQKLIRIIEEHQLFLFDEVTKPVMEAPLYVIPDQFTNHDITVADPVIYNYNSTKTEQPSWEYNTTKLSSASNFNYEVPSTTIPERNNDYIREQDNPVFAQQEELFSNAVANTSLPVEEVMANKTSGDKRMKNLTRKPRVSSQSGPR